MLLLKEDDASSLNSPIAIRLLRSVVSEMNKTHIVLQEIISELKEINTKIKEMSALTKTSK
jgi:hypothetical protein